MGQSPERDTALAGETGTAALGEWMRRYQMGEMEAFERLYELLESPLRRYLRGLAWGSIEAEDLVQATFLQMHRARCSHLPGTAVRA